MSVVPFYVACMDPADYNVVEVGSFEEHGFGILIQQEASIILYADWSENMCVPWQMRTDR